MSTKTSRKTTTTTSSSTSRQSTPMDSTPSMAERPRSPLSPTRVSRMAEKAEMQNLNDRLASYIDAVRSLQAENSVLAKQVTISQETITKETTAVRKMFEQELGEARDILDRTASDKARLEIENKRIREENDDLKSSLDKANKEKAKFEINLNQLEQRYADLQLKCNKATAENKKLHEELKDFEKMKKSFEMTKKHLENETLNRVDLENKLQSLKEEANFKQQMYEREVTQLRTKRREEISEIDGRLSVQYEDKLQAALQELREQYEMQLQSNREEIVQLYENKIRSMQDYSLKNQSANSAALEELRNLQTRFEVTSAQVSSLEASNNSLASRLRELELQLEKERTRNVQRLAAAEEELARTRDEMNNQIKEYHDLLDIKVALDSEINAYRKLLEFEEHRLHITPTVVNTPATRRGTPLRRTTPLKNLKRRRVLDESERSECYKVSGEARGDVEISDVDPEGKYVQLFNKGEKEIAIGGWTVKHSANGEDTVFKLHRSVKIEPNGNVTIWGLDAGHAHEPPQHIAMKQRWFVGDPSTTTVINADGDEVARRQRERVQSSSFRQEYDDETDQADPQKENCNLM